MSPQKNNKALSTQPETQTSLANQQQLSQGSSELSWEEVDCIVAERGRGESKQYRVRWKQRQPNGEPYEDWWLSGKDITEDTLETWNNLKAEREVIRRRKEQKKAEEQARQAKQEEEQKKYLQKDRASRRQNRDLRRATVRDNGGLAIDTSAESSPAPHSIASPLAATAEQPAAQPRKRRIVHDPEDSDIESRSESGRAQSKRLKSLNSPKRPLVKPFVQIPEGIPTEDYDTYPSSIPGSALSAPSPQGSPDPVQSSQVEEQSLFWPSSAVTRVIPDSQSITNSHISAEKPKTATADESQNSNSLNTVSDSINQHSTGYSNSSVDNYSIGLPQAGSILATTGPKDVPDSTPAIKTIPSQSANNPTRQKAVISDAAIPHQAADSSSAIEKVLPVAELRTEPAQLVEPAVSVTRGNVIPLTILPIESEETTTDSPPIADRTELIQDNTLTPELDKGAVDKPSSSSIVNSQSQTSPPPQIRKLDDSIENQPFQVTQQDSLGNFDLDQNAFESQIPYIASHYQENSARRTQPQKQISRSVPKSASFIDTSISKTNLTLDKHTDQRQPHISGVPRGGPRVDSILQDAQRANSFIDTNSHAQTAPSQALFQYENQDSVAIEPSQALISQRQPQSKDSLTITYIDLTGSVPENTPVSARAKPQYKMVELVVPPRPTTPSTPSSVVPVPTNETSDASAEPLDFAARRALRKANRNKELRNSTFSSPFSFEPIVIKREVDQKPLETEVIPTSTLATEIRETSGTRSGSVSERVPISSIIQSHDPHVTLQAEAINSSNLDSAQRPAITQPNFFFPIELSTLQKKLYRDIFNTRRKDLQVFRDTGIVSASLLGLADDAYSVTLHTDLVDNPSMTQAQRTPEKQAEWAIACSTKFKILKELFHQLESSESHIVLFAKDGRALDKVEAFVRGCNITYTRPDEHRSYRSARAGCRVSIIPTGAHQIIERADLVIGLDETFDLGDPQVLQVRRQMIEVNKSCPAIVLVAAYTAEHVARILLSKPTFTTAANHLPSLIAQADAYHQQNLVSAPQTALPTAQDIAVAVADVLSGGLPDPLELLSLDTTTYQLRGIQSAMGLQNGVHIEPLKRRANETELEIDQNTPKKPRHKSPTIYDEPSSAESLTRVLDTAVAPEIAVLQNISSSNNGSLTEAKRLQEALQVEISLRAQNLDLRKQLSTHELTTTTIQRAFDEQFHELSKVKKELALAKTALEAGETRRNTMLTTNTNIRTENTTLKQQLAEVSRERLASTDPAIRTEEELHVKTLRVEELEKKLAGQQASKERDFEYLRNSYNDASSKAIEHAEALTVLEFENAKLKEQASGEAIRLRNMFENNNMKLAQDSLERVKGERDSAHRLIKSLEEENKQLRERLDKRGVAMSTRASSLPPRALEKALGRVVAAANGTADANGKSVAGENGSGGRPAGSVPMARGGSALARSSLLGAGIAGNEGSKATSRAGSRQGSRQGTPAPVRVLNG